MKKLLSILMVLAIVLSLLPMAVFAAENVADFNIDVHPPIIGEHPDFDVSIPSEAHASNAKVIWHEVDDDDNFLSDLKASSVFEEGKKYGAEVKFTVDDGYSITGTTITIDHIFAKGDRSGEEKIAYVKWTALKPIDVIEFNLDMPLDGEHPDFTAELPEGANYTVESVTWGELTAEDAFKAGETYAIELYFLAAKGYAFAKDCKAMWNGKEAALVIYGVDAYSTGSVMAAEKPTATYTVTFDVCGHGEAPEAQTVAEGDVAKQPAGLKAEGWVFGGWFADKEYTKVFQFNEPIKADTTVYAKWTEDKPDDEPKPCDGGKDCPSYKFKDVNFGDWYHEAVDFAVSKGLFNGMSANTFEPNTAMSRAMLVTVLWRYEGEKKEGTNDFTDVPDGQWFTDAVSWAAKNGIVGGVGNGRFDPNGNITREQLAAILYRYSESKKYDVSKRDDFAGFPDKDKVSEWAKDAYGWAVAEGLIAGNDGKLDPQGNATRAQVATILMRFIQKIAK